MMSLAAGYVRGIVLWIVSRYAAYSLIHLLLSSNFQLISIGCWYELVINGPTVMIAHVRNTPYPTDKTSVQYKEFKVVVMF